MDEEQIIKLKAIDSQLSDALGDGRYIYSALQVEEAVASLEQDGVDVEEITYPLRERSRLRTFISHEEFMNALLDIRNTIAPPEKKVEDEVPTEVPVEDDAATDSV